MVAALLRPWRDARTWRELAHLCLDLPVATVTFTVIVTLLATSLGLAVVVLVPATMELLGRANWWLPRWLDRIIPRIRVESTPASDDDPADLDRSGQRVGSSPR